MSTLATNYLTLADWAKRVEDDGQMAIIIDLLSQANEMMEDMLWAPGNQTAGHRTTVRTGLPEGTWRQMYQYVNPTKSTTAQIEVNCGNLEAYSVVDRDLADLEGNSAQFRLSEDSAFIEGLTQQMQAAILYSNSLATPAQIMGFSPQYNTLNTTTAQTANNVIDMGGSGATNTSIWFLQWGANTCFGVFPRAKIGGLQQLDLGLVVDFDSNGGQRLVYKTNFKWEAGLVVRDWRYVVRLANIDVTDLGTVNAANLVNGLVLGSHLFPTAPRGVSPVQAATKPSGVVGMGRSAIYCNRTVSTWLDLQALNKTNVLLQITEWDGMSVTTFRGVPIRTVDQLLSTETALT